MRSYVCSWRAVKIRLYSGVDPGFLRGGLRSHCMAKFFRKSNENEENWAEEGAHARFCLCRSATDSFHNTKNLYALSLLFDVNGSLVGLIIAEVCRGDRFHSASTYLSSRPQTEPSTVLNVCWANLSVETWTLRECETAPFKFRKVRAHLQWVSRVNSCSRIKLQPIFSKAVPSALLMSLEWELWPFQQFCDLFGTFVTFLWPFYDLFSNFMTFFWPLWPFYDLFSTFVTFLWMTKWYYLDLIVTFLWPFQHFYDLFVNDKMILSRSHGDLFMPFSALLWPFCEWQNDTI